MDHQAAVLLTGTDMARAERATHRTETRPPVNPLPVPPQPSVPTGPRLYRVMVKKRPTETEFGVAVPMTYDPLKNSWIEARPQYAWAEPPAGSSSNRYETGVSLEEPLFSLMPPTVRIKTLQQVVAAHFPGKGFGVVSTEGTIHFQPSYTDAGFKLVAVGQRNPDIDIEYAPQPGEGIGTIGVTGQSPIVGYQNYNSFLIYSVTYRFPTWVSYFSTGEPPKRGEIWGPGSPGIPEGFNTTGMLVRERLSFASDFITAIRGYGEVDPNTGNPNPTTILPPPAPAHHTVSQVQPWVHSEYDEESSTFKGQGLLGAGGVFVKHRDDFSEEPYLENSSMVASINTSILYSQFGFKILGVDTKRQLAFVTPQRTPMIEMCVGRRQSRFDFEGINNDPLGPKPISYDGNYDLAIGAPGIIDE